MMISNCQQLPKLSCVLAVQKLAFIGLPAVVMASQAYSLLVNLLVRLPLMVVFSL